MILLRIMTAIGVVLSILSEGQPYAGERREADNHQDVIAAVM